MSAPGRSGRRRRFVLNAATVGVLAWVSYGSHEVLVWIGVPWWPAWIYPAIVDLAVLYVTPFAADVELPEEPIRRHAKNTRKGILPVVTLFNIFHMILFVQQHRPTTLNPGLATAFDVCAYALAVIAGCTPVCLYARMTTLEVLDKSLEVSRDLEVSREDDRKRKAAQERSDQRDLELEDAEHKVKLKTIEARGDAEVARESTPPVPAEDTRPTRESTRPTRATSTRATPDPEAEKAAYALAKYATDDRAVLDGLVAALPTGTKGQRGKQLLAEAWDAGVELQPTDAGRLLGFDGGYGRNLAKTLKEEGTLPPSERPRLALAGR